MQRRRKIVAAVAAAAMSMMLGLQDTPAQATGSTGVITDGDGLDYDVGCVVLQTLPGAAPSANRYASPGGSGCNGTSAYDGSAESIDLRSASLESTSTGRLKASIVVDGPLPAAGDTNRAAFDGISPTSAWGEYFVLFQNKDKQTGADNPNSGCTSGLHTRFADRHGHWEDGFQFFLMYEVVYTQGRWEHLFNVGEWEPETPYPFYVTTIARNTGSGWTTVQAPMVGRWATSVTGTGPTTIDMEVTGVVRIYEPNCIPAGGVFELDLASNRPGPFSGPGYTSDTIINVKGATYGEVVYGPPVDAFGWPGMYSWNGWSDVTSGNSTAGSFNTNIPGIALTHGVTQGYTENFSTGPFCRFNVAGERVQNPAATLMPNEPCKVDDDQIDRGTYHLEWWDTAYGFNF